MAHQKGTRKRPRRIFGYRRKGELSSPSYRLQARFLQYVAGECPATVADLEALHLLAASALEAWGEHPHAAWKRLSWQELQAIAEDPKGAEREGGIRSAPLLELHHALKEWAATYHLAEPWILKGALTSFDDSYRHGWPIRLQPGFFTYRPPLMPDTLTFESRGYDGDESVTEYRTKTLAAFTASLDRHLEESLSRLDSDHAVERVSYGHSKTERALRAAARWQTLGEFPTAEGLKRDAVDFDTLLDVFYRIRVTPRPGLANS